jgi:hypothetical protein
VYLVCEVTLYVEILCAFPSVEITPFTAGVIYPEVELPHWYVRVAVPPFATSVTGGVRDAVGTRTPTLVYAVFS